MPSRCRASIPAPRSITEISAVRRPPRLHRDRSAGAVACAALSTRLKKTRSISSASKGNGGSQARSSGKSRSPAPRAPRRRWRGRAYAPGRRCQPQFERARELQKRVTRELVRSTSEAMNPAISRATSFSAATLRLSISADALMVPSGLRNSVGEGPPKAGPARPGGRSAALLPPPAGCGRRLPPTVPPCAGIFPIGCAIPPPAHSPGCPPWPGKPSQRQLGDLRRPDVPLRPIDEQEERQVRTGRQQGKHQRPDHAQERCRRDHRQQQHQPETALNSARVAISRYPSTSFITIQKIRLRVEGCAGSLGPALAPRPARQTARFRRHRPPRS